MGDTDLNYNFIDDLKFRKGIDIEIDFLGYNFSQTAKFDRYYHKFEL